MVSLMTLQFFFSTWNGSVRPLAIHVCTYIHTSQYMHATGRQRVRVFCTIPYYFPNIRKGRCCLIVVIVIVILHHDFVTFGMIGIYICNIWEEILCQHRQVPWKIYLLSLDRNHLFPPFVWCHSLHNQHKYMDLNCFDNRVY